MYITAVTTSFDPHTSYMSKGTFENFLIQMGLELEGIGATLQATDDGYTVIKNIVPGGAAATQGGLKVEDKIMAVGQGDDEGARLYRKLAEEHGTDFVDATGMKLDDVVGMIRGKAGTVVRLSVQSENEEELHTVMIVREKIKLEDSAAHGVIFEEGVKNDGSPNKIGVIELPSFYANMGGGGAGGRSTTTDVRKILDDFTDKNVDAVVLDLRSNGGGSLREAIDCTGLFIDLGPVVQVKNAYGDIEKHNDEVSGMSWDGPLVVLTSKFSASASEILAGAVQDYGRGLVVGDTTTHGKGTVQSLINLNQIIYKVKNPPNDFGALKITMQQFYRPNGDSTQKRGVLSDLVLPSITDKMDVGESDLDYPVEFDQVPRASFKGYAMADEAIKKQLQLNSKERVDSSDDFASQVRKINHYVEQKNLKSVSLNQEKFLARRRQLNAEKEDEKAIEKQIIPSREIERTYYLDEVLRITSDYMNLLSKNS
jgi:carboxyl-terminal processing protease